MTRRWLTVIAAVAVALALGGGVGGAQTMQTIAVPAYFYPGPLWTQLQAAAPAVGLVVANPNSGPGVAADPNYAAAIAQSQTHGQRVIGYVHTSYGQRSQSDVLAEVDRYFAWYRVDGIFFDEASANCARQPYYAALRHAVRAHSAAALTVLNPGTQTAECYMAAADVIVTFEDTYAAYTHSYTAPRWVNSYAPERFWHIVHSTATTQQMQNAVRLSQQRRAGRIYVTNDVLPNPYDTLPAAYWSAEVAQVTGNR